MIADSWLLESLIPLPISGNDALWWPGVLLLSIAIVIAVVCLLQFFRARTHVEPWQPTRSIIQTGLFRYSRNPIYLSFCIATLATGLLLDSWWPVATLPPLALLLQALVIRKEEAYLEAKFGEDYLDYRRRVRRWL
jgi:protein-S-isoprenylcysteine O-methyltransferase Ste14